MRESVKAKFGGKVLLGVTMAGLVLLALTVSFPVSAGAAGDSPGDAKLQAARSDIEACMQPGDAGKKGREAFAKKYNVSLSKVNEKTTVDRPPAGNGGWDSKTANTVCDLEVYCTLGIGDAVWRARSDSECGRDNIASQSYCVAYSERCDHYHWAKGCVTKDNFPQCFKK